MSHTAQDWPIGAAVLKFPHTTRDSRSVVAAARAVASARAEAVHDRTEEVRS
ncbi:hypothetical protein [Streptomyces scopuliridis]|uniref:hypothetical protein n=1 Tax=Streptomyces scopuliridis TaxID=452529 RepID=UPI0034151C59